VNKRPGQIRVTVETGYCTFCARVRNLRREERQLGALIRTVVACESCHRVLSSTVGVADADAPVAEVATEPAAVKPPAATRPAAAARTKPAAAAKPRKTAAAAPAKPKAPASRTRPTK
jgi:hypothetical protein